MDEEKKSVTCALCGQETPRYRFKRWKLDYAGVLVDSSLKDRAGKLEPGATICNAHVRIPRTRKRRTKDGGSEAGDAAEAEGAPGQKEAAPLAEAGAASRKKKRGGAPPFVVEPPAKRSKGATGGGVAEGEAASSSTIRVTIPDSLRTLIPKLSYNHGCRDVHLSSGGTTGKFRVQVRIHGSSLRFMVAVAPRLTVAELLTVALRRMTILLREVSTTSGDAVHGILRDEFGSVLFENDVIEDVLDNPCAVDLYPTSATPGFQDPGHSSARTDASRPADAARREPKGSAPTVAEPRERKGHEAKVDNTVERPDKGTRKRRSRKDKDVDVSP
mmetsp:Transcript_4679/g.13095  ORF Transcript_4679/g.13095 Transcript_4679/m.13095 type:complete len:330 (+) Transcript_4679:103-1092(+)|eukprot:CAMPEP_0119133682 /NCGR_PEP_ID=MMETSP1310-20130426/13501_1 /TAXON_ID=464262 /ORGANISM="Genus nov. species nov., Strain RCC2339" /LENGTH=329 /DNA_ID=CAMNT_0007124383 /DNA_START=80 /DNA_END=1069 /DNA_ORIENTATION=+